MRTVYIDPKLATYIVPSEMRNNSKAENKVFTPGTRIALPKEAEFVRLFTAWGTKKETGNRGMDIDLSGAFIWEDTNGNLKLERISFYNQSANYAVHSGDFTSCKKYEPGVDKTITAEYIDIDLKRVKEAGFHYIITAEFIYDASVTKDYDTDINAYSGVILLDNMRATKEQFIDINNSLFKVKLAGKYQSHTAIAIDVETMEIVILDQYSEERSGMTVDAMAGKMNAFKKLYFNASEFNENMYDLLNMYCEANNITVVSDIKEANMICSYDDYKELAANQTMFNISNNLENIINLLN